MADTKVLVTTLDKFFNIKSGFSVAQDETMFRDAEVHFLLTPNKADTVVGHLEDGKPMVVQGLVKEQYIPLVLAEMAIGRIDALYLIDVYHEVVGYKALDILAEILAGIAGAKAKDLFFRMDYKRVKDATEYKNYVIELASKLQGKELVELREEHSLIEYLKQGYPHQMEQFNKAQEKRKGGEEKLILPH